MTDHLPILGVCGYGGSGKTTLIEGLLPPLREAGLSIAVIKHSAHSLDMGPKRKDSDRLFNAGADVLLCGPQDRVFLQHGQESLDVTLAAQELCHSHDLVLVEGFKHAPWPKLWLNVNGSPPEEVTEVLGNLGPGDARLPAATAIVQQFLAGCSAKTPLMAGMLIGGQSRRMGRPKHLLPTGARTWLENTVELLDGMASQTVLLGAGDVPASLSARPRLADAPEAQGPMAGVLSALRHAPRCAWLIVACDMPDINRDALAWLLSCRRAGAWAVVPRTSADQRAQPLLAWYDFRSRGMLEGLAAQGRFKMSDVTDHPKVLCPEIPQQHAAAWHNVNEPTDFETGEG